MIRLLRSKKKYAHSSRSSSRKSSFEEAADAKLRAQFDKEYYLWSNPDVKSAGIDPFVHYMETGWREGRNPSQDFNTINYLQANKDVLASGANPFEHYILNGKNEGRALVTKDEFELAYLRRRAPHFVQDGTFPLDAEKAEALFVILVPEHNTMSGGIYSFFSIAKAAFALRHKHNYQILLMTRPNPFDVTYLRQSNFRNSEDVFRFEQIVRCRAAKEVYIHVPEYAAPTFVKSLSTETLEYLRSRARLYVNILNQNTKLMPEKEDFEDLRLFATELSQSVAHHSYFSQALADHYELPTLLLPAYTDLSGYEPIEYESKEKLIIYSPDDSPHKDATLKALGAGLPDYKLVEIRDITFDKFMDLATRCRFSITFGEGFDGYLAQPIHQNGLGFAVYNEDFFPFPELRDFTNIFKSDQDMLANVVSRIRGFESDVNSYRAANLAMKEVYNRLYSKSDYMRRVEKLINRDFELFPSANLRSIVGMHL